MKDKINDDGPAFPDPGIYEDSRQGMSLRDWYAGKFAAAWVIALSHRCAIHEGESGYSPVSDSQIAAEANRLGLIQADAILIAREKGQS